MTEEELIRKYSPLIYYVANRFMVEKNMIPAIYADDVMQEARIALIKWYRKNNEGAYGENGDKYIGTAIRYHLDRMFVMRFGVHVPPGRKCDVRVYPAGELTSSASDSEFNESDCCYQCDVDDWTETLKPNEQVVVKMLINGDTPRAIMKATGMTVNAYKYYRKRIMRAYRKRFPEVV